MWQLISANKTKSLLLFTGMFLALSAMGFFIGGAVDPRSGPAAGLAMAVVIAVFMGLLSYFSGGDVILAMAGAKEVTREMYPQLFNIVEEMKISAGLPVMPRVYIVSDMAPNAFATGRSPEKSAIAVTAGLLSRLNRDELQGVIAHEVGHIINRDILFMTFSGVMLGSIIFLSEIFLRSMRYSGRFSGRRSSGRGGQAQVVFLIIAVLFALLGPILAQLLYFAISRRRELLADATGVRLTRYPEGLASALEKISQSQVTLFSRETAPSKVVAPMYTVNPLQESRMGFSAMTSTHPPTDLRIKILRGMAGGAGYSDYQQSYERSLNRRAGLIPSAELAKKEAVGIRALSAEAEAPKAAQNIFRDAGDIIRAAGNYAFLTCGCGLKMKIPPDYKKTSIPCPKCGKENAVPSAEMAVLSSVLGPAMGRQAQGPAAAGAVLPPLHYTRRTQGWETFSCSCGSPVQISPQFMAPRVTCPKCGRKTEIDPAAA